MITTFIILQIILLFVMTLHDWVHVPPLTDIRAIEQHSTKRGRLINSAIFALIVLIPLLLTWFYCFNYPRWVLMSITLFYGILTLGTIFSWWVPYLFGSSSAHKKAFMEYKDTHHFLPPRGDNVIPNTFHVILHLQIWTCFAMSLYVLLYFWK